MVTPGSTPPVVSLIVPISTASCANAATGASAHNAISPAAIGVADALQRLMLYDWPGNVRELANVVERAVVLSTHGTISSDLLLLGNKEGQSPRYEPLKLREAREQFEKAYLVQVLTTVKG